ncbi:hypothetical protein WMY93_027274 [Mugilogobius chulae]|uniref:TRIM8/14/16/25/29/45/65 coiled-coil region domain-containing protein n=1 Tax=Mugilogobius chulae TaxID=88201 RepID=A0AAW0MTI7_9GOBI
MDPVPPHGQNYSRVFFQSSRNRQEKDPRPVVTNTEEKEAEQQKLDQDVLTLKRTAHEAVKHSEERFKSFVRELESVHTNVTNQIRSLQEREEAKIKQIHDRLQQEITELKKTLNEAAPLTVPLTPPSAQTHRTYTLPLGFLEQATSAVTALTDCSRSH